MLEPLGLSATAETVYRAMLAHPEMGVAQLSHQTGVPVAKLRGALDELAALALLRPRSGAPDQLLPASPELGLSALLTKAEAEVARRQRQVDAARTTVAAIAAEYRDGRDREELTRFDGVDMVRERLAELAASAETECLSFTPAGPRAPEAMDASRPLNHNALDRGVTIRAVYQDSIRNDPDRLAYAAWLILRGGQTRTVPTVPVRMVIIDRRAALVPVTPADPGAGALEVRSPGLVAALCTLFDLVWSDATPVGVRPPVDQNGLAPQERELLRLLNDGHTDESAARRLVLSVRTVRRMMADLMTRLDADSRFQAGASAVRRGWL